MPIQASYHIDDAAAQAFLDAVRQRAAQGKSYKSALAWGVGKICESLGAQTPRSKGMRPIVDNPDPRAKTDLRMAKWGVMKYTNALGKTNPYFLPIRGTGEFGKIRFISYTTGQVLTRDRITGEVRKLDLAMDEKKALNLKNHPKRKIGRQGFAKKSWQFLKMKSVAGGVVFVDGIPDMGSVAWSQADSTVTVNNKVRYMTKVLSGGAGAVNSAIRAATAGMVHQITNSLFGKGAEAA